MSDKKSARKPRARASSDVPSDVPSQVPSQVPRRRLSAEQARARILEAAARRLAEVGPEGLRLTELATELGVSHPAILHHFGSREGLVAAVVRQAVATLNQELETAFDQRPGRVAILEMLAEFFAEKGNARLIAWLLLSGRLGTLPGQLGDRPPLRPLIERAHQGRLQAARPAEPLGAEPRTIDFEDSKFRSQLTALALLGEAVFGDLIRLASGDATGPEQSRDFRRRLASLLNDTM
ncbi:MAG: TetR/AcrR family transcriptional regulator [Myxococcales bacterium]|nr:TetR/AcrR family transcriptional regulator [Myxococcales bacterium]